MREEKLEEIKIYIDELKTINFAQKIEKSKFIKSEIYDCYLNNGKIINREKLIKASSDGDAAVILPITKDKNVILVVEPRVFSELTVGIGLPAGYVEKGESYLQAAIRELEEEIGYTPTEIISLGSHYQDMGCSAALNECYIANECVKVGEQRLDDGEYIKYIELTIEEAYELMDMGYIKDANAVITLLKAKKYVKGR